MKLYFVERNVACATGVRREPGYPALIVFLKRHRLKNETYLFTCKLVAGYSRVQPTVGIGEPLSFMCLYYLFKHLPRMLNCTAQNHSCKAVQWYFRRDVVKFVYLDFRNTAWAYCDRHKENAISNIGHPADVGIPTSKVLPKVMNGQESIKYEYSD